MIKIVLVALLAGMLICLAGCGGSSSDSTPNPFAGNYSGTFKGTITGTWTMTVGSDGTAKTTFNGNNGAGIFALTGSMSTSGSLLVQGNSDLNGELITWGGTFTTSNGAVTGTGTWGSDTGDNGTWTGSRTSS
jgi:hypothetical protein